MANDTLERTYTIPLRKESQKASRQKRTNRAVKAVRVFLAKHMKSKNVKLGTDLNLLLWKDGSRNPPGKVTVLAVKDAEGNVIANLEGKNSRSPKQFKKPAPLVAKVKDDEKKEGKSDAKSEAKPEAKKETIKAKPEEAVAKDVPKEAQVAKEAVEKSAPKADDKVHDNIETKAEENDKKSKAADKVDQVSTKKSKDM